MNAIFNMKDATMNATQTAAPAKRPLAEKAMLASLTIRQWDGRKLDKSATAKVTDEAGAAANAARVTKSLVAKSALAAIAGIATQARAEHYKRCLPWADNGTRILSSVGYLPYVEKMRALRESFDAEVSAFLACYPAEVEKARVDLGALFDATDYPSADELKARFQFPRPRFFPLPAAADFRVDIGAEALADERAEIEANMQELLEGAMRDVFARIAETVGAMADKLKAFKPAAGKGGKSEGIFRDSLVENVRELVAVLPSLNITGDAKLADLAERMKALCETDASVLREHADVRKHVADKAAEIAAEVADYF